MSGSGSPGRQLASEIELKRDFLSADTNRDRAINFNEFVLILQNLEADMTLAEMRIGFMELDTNHDGLIDFREFVDWWTSD
jgi:Ca2+-binding EF-hand superfamily protein